MSEETRAPAGFPLGVVDPFCAQGHVVAESIDRRMLWHLEGYLAVSGTTDELRAKGRAIARHLADTCEHHWHEHDGDPDIPAHRQCMWCNVVEWAS